MSWSSRGRSTRESVSGRRSRNGNGKFMHSRRLNGPSKSEKFAFSTGAAFAKGATGQPIKFRSKDSAMRKAFKAGYKSVVNK